MDELYSNEEVFALIENEGIGYAIRYCLNADRIQDADLAAMWDEARQVINDIESYLADFAPNEGDDE